MKAVWGALALGLIGCGGEAYEGDDVVDETILEDAPVELDALEEPIIAFFGYGYRIDTNGIGVACGNVNGEQCVIPRSKTVKYCVTSTGLAPIIKAAIEADVDAQVPIMNAQFSGWSFSRSCNSPDVNIEGGVVSGGAETAAMAYARLIPVGLTGPISIVGGVQHFKPTAGVPVRLVIDTAQINTHAVNNRVRVRRHVLFGGMSGAAGNGWTGAHVGNITSIALTPNSPKTLQVSASEECRTEGYDPGGAFHFQFFGC